MKDIRPVIVAVYCSPTLACIRSWGRQGWKTGLVCIQKETEPRTISSYLNDLAILAPEKLYTADGIEIISEFLKRFRANGVTCIFEDTACWINDNRHLLPKNIAIWLADNKIIKPILSKQKQLEVARSVGFHVLPTYFISLENCRDHSIPPEHFPLCLRPAEPNIVKPFFKVRLVFSKNELFDFMGSLGEIRAPIIAQPFMNMPNLLVHGCRSRSGVSFELAAFIVRRKFQGIALSSNHLR